VRAWPMCGSPGSLGALSLILSESGGNITEVAAHNTSDGLAVDMFSITNLERINDEASTRAPPARQTATHRHTPHQTHTRTGRTRRRTRMRWRPRPPAPARLTSRAPPYPPPSPSRDLCTHGHGTRRPPTAPAHPLPQPRVLPLPRPLLPRPLSPCPLTVPSHRALPWPLPRTRRFSRTSTSASSVLSAHQLWAHQLPMTHTPRAALLSEDCQEVTSSRVLPGRSRRLRAAAHRGRAAPRAAS
jgi:hypothetical protein